MDEAPSFVDSGMVEQPAHRTNARPGDAVLDFLDLFGGVDVNGTVARERYEFVEFAWAHGAKAMRRNADPLSVLRLDQPTTIVEKARE
jgi:hypothetical protein